MRNYYLTVLFVFSLGTVSVKSQEKIQDAKAKQSTVASMTNAKEQMNLTTEQEARFNEIVKKYNIATRDIQKRRYSRENKEIMLEQLNEQTEAEMKTLLQPEQYQTYLKLNVKRKSEKVDMRKKPVLGSVKAK
ncbi:hypothetical protein G4D82_11905 [Flavobacterium sp. CYK-4]|uniref:hypothetical protein n=1 Tax=Flavobacterium lotistagni TaxID=2709660 RepID=UPI00140818B6|nr:hypothetical protein [Flavobacterium lotistagni]NHM07929.1 hypothetical protein [Flavobacterium lotistagni]